MYDFMPMDVIWMCIACGLLIFGCVSIVAVVSMIISGTVSWAYKKFALQYKISSREKAEVIAKLFNGRPAEANDPEPLFDETLLMVSCNGGLFEFENNDAYTKCEVGQTVYLVTHHGVNKCHEVKDIFYTLEF